MSTVSSEWQRSESVASRLIPFRQRANRLNVARIVLIGGLISLGVLLAAMWFDLIWALPMEVRWAVTRLGPPVAIVGISAICWWRSRQSTAGQLALHIDRHQRTGGEVLSGWQLEQSPPKASKLTQGLAQMASNRAGERLDQVPPASVFPADNAKRAGWFLFAGIVATAILSAIIPSVAWNQYQRFAFPARDVPPYTGVTIELEPTNASVRYGDDFSVLAKVTRGDAERLQLVTMTPDGKEHALPMLPQQENRWQVILSRVTTPLDFYARSGASRSRVGRLDVQMTPEIVATKVRIAPPAYAKRAAYVGAIPKDGISGLPGTEVEFTATSNRPLSEGFLMLTYRDGSNDRILLKSIADDSGSEENSTTVRGSMKLAKAGKFQLGVTDVGHIESRENVEGTISITADGRPSVRILEPKPLSLATPDVALQVVVAAEDDFGITSLQLYRSLNGSAATPMACVVDGGPRQNAVVDLPLYSYGLQPGDEIQLFARTEDNDPAGAKGAESPVTTVRIISTADFQQMLLQQEGAESLVAKYQAAERYLENLAEAIAEAQQAAEEAKAAEESLAAEKAKATEGEASEGNEANEAKAAEAAKKLQEKLAAAQEAAEKAAKNIEKIAQEPLPIDVDQALSEKLAEMARDAGEASQELGEMAENRQGQPKLSQQEQEQLQELAEKFAERRKQLEEQAIKPLKNMQDAMPLVIDQQLFVELTKRQRDLAQRIDALKSDADVASPKTQRRVAELEAEQQQIRELLANLLDDIEVHADALPDDPELENLRQTSHEFVTAVRDSDVFDEMAGAQESLLDDFYPEASEHASKAAEIMESFLSKCNSMGEGACKSCQMGFNPSLGAPPLGNSIEQMLAMMGMKPGMGGNPGMGTGFGAGGGYSMRTPGSSNVGMYGSLPQRQTRSSQGRSNQQSRGSATNSSDSPQNAGDSGTDVDREGVAAGQAESGVPSQYRAQVSKYFQQVAEQLGEEP